MSHKAQGQKKSWSSLSRDWNSLRQKGEIWGSSKQTRVSVSDRTRDSPIPRMLLCPPFLREGFISSCWRPASPVSMGHNQWARHSFAPLPTHCKNEKWPQFQWGRTLVGLLGLPVLIVVRYRGGPGHDWVHSAIYRDVSGHTCKTIPWVNLELIS